MTDELLAFVLPQRRKEALRDALYPVLPPLFLVVLLKVSASCSRLILLAISADSWIVNSTLFRPAFIFETCELNL